LHFFAFRIFVAGQRRYFNFGTLVGHSQSHHTDYKPSLKGAWLRHVTHFKFGGPYPYLSNGLS